MGVAGALAARRLQLGDELRVERAPRPGSSPAAPARRRRARRPGPASRRRRGWRRPAAGLGPAPPPGAPRWAARQAQLRPIAPPPTNTASKSRFSVKPLPPPALPGSGSDGRRPRCHPLSPRGLPFTSDATPPRGRSGHVGSRTRRRHNRGMSLAPPESAGPLRRERLRTARLYFVCDARPARRGPEALLRAALSGGADIVQLREKELGRAEIERAAATFRRVCDTYSALFIVNDDPDLARACDADGVHVGQDDGSVGGRRGRCSGPTRSSASPPTRRSRSPPPPSARSTTSASGRSGRRRRKPGAPPSASTRPPRRRARAHPFFGIGGIDAGNAAQVVARRGERGSAWCGRSATPPTRWPPPKSCAAASGWRPVAEAGARRAQEPRKRKQRGGARPDEGGLRQGRGAQPGGARSAEPAGRGRAAAGRDDRGGRRGLIALSIVAGYLAGVKVNGETPRARRRSLAPAADHGRDGLGHVARPLLGRARLPADPRLPDLRRRLRARGPGLDRRPVRRHPGLLAVAGTFFFFMVKAMARIQMPERVPRD